MVEQTRVNANIDGLKGLMRMLKKDYRVRVGILQEKQHDNKSGLTNAQIGAFHEFGTSKMAQRSFLMMPLQEKLSEEIPKLKKYIFKQLFVKTAPKKFYDDLASISRDIVWKAFDTEGFGQWKLLTKSTRDAISNKAAGKGWRNGRITKFRKGLVAQIDHQILTDTGRLRGSIQAKVITK